MKLMLMTLAVLFTTTWAFAMGTLISLVDAPSFLKDFCKPKENGEKPKICGTE